jgi:hypothetical protein
MQNWNHSDSVSPKVRQQHVIAAEVESDK